MLGQALRASSCFAISSYIVSIRRVNRTIHCPCAVPYTLNFFADEMILSCNDIADWRLNFSPRMQHQNASQWNCGICEVCCRVILYILICHQRSHASVRRLSYAVYISLGVAFLYLCTNAITLHHIVSRRISSHRTDTVSL